MIDVMKRLAELDAMNPNVQTESYRGVQDPEGVAIKRAGHRDAAGEESGETGVLVNGKVWKTFPSRQEAQRVVANLQRKYPGKKIEINGDAYEGMANEGMSEVDEVMQDIASGAVDPYDIMNHPTTPSEQAAAKMLHQKYDEIASQHNLHPDDDHEKIFDIMIRELSQEYSSDNADAHMPQLESIRKLAGMKPLAECGMPGMPSSMPASISMTAGSGPELSGMLRDIMSLAGLQKVTPDHLGAEPAPMKLAPEPAMQAGPAMRAVLDTLHMDDEEELEGYDNTPSDPTEPPEFDANEFAHHENEPGAGDVPKDHDSRPRVRNQPTATMETMTRSLFAEYNEFINESEWTAEKPAKKLSDKEKKESDALKTKATGNTAALKKTSDAFGKKKVDEVSAFARGVKHIKRTAQGWGNNDSAITGTANKPKDIVARNKGYDDTTTNAVHTATNAPIKHSPADLQKRVLDREMKKRGMK